MHGLKKCNKYNSTYCPSPQKLARPRKTRPSESASMDDLISIKRPNLKYGRVYYRNTWTRPRLSERCRLLLVPLLRGVRGRRVVHR